MAWVGLTIFGLCWTPSGLICPWTSSGRQSWPTLAHFWPIFQLKMQYFWFWLGQATQILRPKGQIFVWALAFPTLDISISNIIMWFKRFIKSEKLMTFLSKAPCQVSMAFVHLLSWHELSSKARISKVGYFKLNKEHRNKTFVMLYS